MHVIPFKLLPTETSLLASQKVAETICITTVFLNVYIMQPKSYIELKTGTLIT
jgi:hypothetical protein